MKRMQTIAAFVAGLLFGSGLLYSRMVNPANVQAFLDVTGAWQPALLFTMAAAVVVAAPAFWWARHSRRALRGVPVELPRRMGVDRSLVVGSVIFGVGWGLSGICPGPGLLLLSRADRGAVVFALGLAAGMVVAGLRTLHTRGE